MDELRIAQKIDAMIEYAYVALRHFPKSERHVLSQEIRAYSRGEIGLPRITARVRSWLAHAAHADTHRIRTRLLETFRL